MSDQGFLKQQFILYTEAEFLDEIQTKVLKVFLLDTYSLLYSFALRFLFLQTHATSYMFHQTHINSYVFLQAHATSYSFYSSVTVHCKGERRKT
jgi:hypothetical protein